MARGPLAVRWVDWQIEPPQAGSLGTAHIELENAGTVRWRRGINLGYHWLDERGDPLVWDGERTDLPHLDPGERATVAARVRAPIPPGRYRLAFDLVAELRAWFSELGGEQAVSTVDVGPRLAAHAADLPPWVEPAAEWAQRVAAAHAEGYAVVAGAIDWQGGRLRPRPRSLEAHEPGRGRIPGFAHPLVCPSVVEGVRLDPLPACGGLPAFAAPPEEPWIYDGRIVLVAHPERRA